jgi:hypothetical protein
MRTARFLLLIVYVAGHAGLPLPLPAGAGAGAGGAGACGCGDACQCAPQNIAAGNCCCAPRGGPSPATKSSCCAATFAADRPAKAEACHTATSERAGVPQARSCCGEPKADACCNDERPRPPVLLACGCQQEAPEGIAACSDPRVLSAAAGPPRSPVGDWLAPARGPIAPLLVQSPDDPVPRLTA